jgi:hypothetical protein
MTIEVSYKLFSTNFAIKKALKILMSYPIISFDTETRGLYLKEERAKATRIISDDEIKPEDKKVAYLIANNSGLSFPSLVRVTHFVFGISEDFSIIFIANDPSTEMLIWNWLKEYPGKLLIHNTLYDLKIMHNRVGALPKDYEDTQLLAKAMINNADSWKAKVGLKELMGDDYDPAWTLIHDYEPENLKDFKFLRYASIDGAATFKLWCDIQHTINGDSWDFPENDTMLWDF